MKKRVLWSVVVSLLVASSSVPQARADVKLPKLIGSHMVLQRDLPLPIWGWADPGEEVVVKLDEATVSTKADAKGNWKVVLPAVKADGKAHRMIVSGKNKIELEDILIGEVWLGGGQSNMKMGIGKCDKAKEQITAANYPKIRLFCMPPSTSKRAPGLWAECSPETVGAGAYGNWGGFSGVLYYFGQRLHKDLDVPVGLISSSKGGTSIESWTASDSKSVKKSGKRYSGMIAPFIPFAIRGVVWYQGEANVGDGLKYADKMKTLIEGWRRGWGYDFPFYFVQLPSYSYKPGQLPPIWEAQAASLKIPGTGMVVTTDLADIKNVHPKNKFDVGNRLALGRQQRQRSSTPCRRQQLTSASRNGPKASKPTFPG